MTSVWGLIPKRRKNLSLGVASQDHFTLKRAGRYIAVSESPHGIDVKISVEDPIKLEEINHLIFHKLAQREYPWVDADFQRAMSENNAMLWRFWKTRYRHSKMNKDERVRRLVKGIIKFMDGD